MHKHVERQIVDNLAAKKRYIKCYAKLGFTKKSATAAGIRYRTLSIWRLADPEFALQELEAKQTYLEKLEFEADRRAVDGVEKGVYFQGDKVDTELKYSDQLLMFRLKKLDSDYRDSRGAAEGSGPTTVNIYLPDNSRPDDKIVIDVTPSTTKIEDKS